MIDEPALWQVSIVFRHEDAEELLARVLHEMPTGSSYSLERLDDEAGDE